MKPITLKDRVRFWAQNYGGRTAFRVIDSHEHVELTYSEYWNAANCLANHMLAHNMTETIGSISLNHFKWNILDLAIDILGGTHASISPTFDSETLCHAAVSTNMRVIFVPNNNWMEIFRTRFSNHKIEILTFEQIMIPDKPVHEDVSREIHRVQNPVQGKSILFSSGTSTTHPKAVLHNNSNFMTYAEFLYNQYQLQLSDSALSFLPVCHGYEKSHSYCMQAHGITVTYANSALSVGQNFQLAKPTFVTMVPHLLSLLQQEITSNPTAPPSTFIPILISCSGASLPQSVGDFFQSVGATIVMSYGLSECLGVTSTQKENCGECQSGFALPYVDLKLRDREILVNTSTMFSGYIENGKVVRGLTDDGYFETNDIGQLSEGCLAVLARKEEIFKLTNGRFFDPRSLELTLQQSTSFEIVPVLGMSPNGNLILIVNHLHETDSGLTAEIRHVLYQHNSVCATCETVSGFIVTSNQWKAGGNFRTHNGKLKRYAIIDYYLSESCDERCYLV